MPSADTSSNWWHTVQFKIKEKCFIRSRIKENKLWNLPSTGHWNPTYFSMVRWTINTGLNIHIKTVGKCYIKHKLWTIKCTRE
jgi:hypothetical protein